MEDGEVTRPLPVPQASRGVTKFADPRGPETIADSGGPITAAEAPSLKQNAEVFSLMQHDVQLNRDPDDSPEHDHMQVERRFVLSSVRLPMPDNAIHHVHESSTHASYAIVSPTSLSQRYGPGATLPRHLSIGDNNDLSPIGTIQAYTSRLAASIALIRFDIQPTQTPAQVLLNIIPGHYVDSNLVLCQQPWCTNPWRADTNFVIVGIRNDAGDLEYPVTNIESFFDAFFAIPTQWMLPQFDLNRVLPLPGPYGPNVLPLRATRYEFVMIHSGEGSCRFLNPPTSQQQISLHNRPDSGDHVSLLQTVHTYHSANVPSSCSSCAASHPQYGYHCTANFYSDAQTASCLCRASFLCTNFRPCSYTHAWHSLCSIHVQIVLAPSPTPVREY